MAQSLNLRLGLAPNRIARISGNICKAGEVAMTTAIESSAPALRTNLTTDELQAALQGVGDTDGATRYLELHTASTGHG